MYLLILDNQEMKRNRLGKKVPPLGILSDSPRLVLTQNCNKQRNSTLMYSDFSNSLHLQYVDQQHRIKVVT